MNRVCVSRTCVNRGEERESSRPVRLRVRD